ncbi:MAG: hypothetical protein IT342_07795 [Candidatus Melainabacteria bacterium]|nr:hypothetical protein [Candidatus Melainabacteria bacterium]
MNSINALLVPTFVSGSDSFSNLATFGVRCAQSLAVRRLLLATYLGGTGLLLAAALDIQTIILIVAFACCGLWASPRLSSRSSAMVTPILILLNLICWREAFLALPIAALTIALAHRFSVNQNCRDFLKLSGIVGASLTLIVILGKEVFQVLAQF